MKKILIIKLSALGDMIVALRAFHAIAKFHQGSNITLLTSAPFIELAKRTGYFSEVISLSRPKFYQLKDWFKIRSFLINNHFDTVYDLQNNNHVNFYHKLFWPHQAPIWAGTAKYATYHINKQDTTHIHALDRHLKMLELAGITNIPELDLSFMKTDISHLNLPANFFTIIPGAAPHRILKRWAPQYFAQLINLLWEKYHYPSVIIGSIQDAAIIKEITSKTEHAISLMGKTSLFDIASIGFKTTAMIGNDTGPAHIIAGTNCPSIILFSKDSSPTKSRPQGQKVICLQKPCINDLSVEEVFAKLN